MRNSDAKMTHTANIHGAKSEANKPKDIKEETKKASKPGAIFSEFVKKLSKIEHKDVDNK